MVTFLENCQCGKKTYGIMGRTGCVTVPDVPYLFVFRPRLNGNSQRNTLELNDANLGTTIKNLITQSTSDDLRIYPTPKVFEFGSTPTDVKYQTASDDTKFRLPGGEVYEFAGQFMGKDATTRLYAEFEKNGCGETDIWMVDVSLNIWMVSDDLSSTLVRGIGITGESLSSSYGFTTNAATSNVPFKFDLETKDDIKKMVPITQEEHGLTLDDFEALIPVETSVVAVNTTTLTLGVYDGFKTIASGNGFVGLTNAEISFTDVTTGSAVAGSTVEVGEGVYTFTASAAMTAGNEIEVSISPSVASNRFFNSSSAKAV